jgi:putative SOS response-associated peptidase YedK
MCGRFTLILSKDEIKDEFGTEDAPTLWEPSYNISPSQSLPIITKEQPAHWQIMKWGINRTFNNQHRFIINIRKETLIEKNTFKTLIKNNRCIIPASGFFEWKKEGQPTKKSFPYYFEVSNGKSIAFAGLWDEGGVLNKKEFEFAIITCPANPLVNQVHGRMPVILDKQGQELWLSNLNMDEKLQLLQPFGETKMTCIPVSQQVNNPSYNSKDCIEPIAGQQKFEF